MSRQMRRRRNRMKKVCMIGTVLILLCIGIFVVSVKTASATDTTIQKFKYYTTITVESGDTLWSIAEEYRTEEYASLNKYIDELKSINNLTDSTIISGSSLVVPYYSSEYKI